MSDEQPNGTALLEEWLTTDLLNKFVITCETVTCRPFWGVELSTGEAGVRVSGFDLQKTFLQAKQVHTKWLEETNQ